MLGHDFSQLPVMHGERAVKGAISWRSIATRLALGQAGSVVREFMDPVDILPSTASVFDAIRVIAENQYVLVQGADRRIVGIVTSSDLSMQLRALTEPLLLLSEIEHDLRRVLQSKFSPGELATVKDPADTSRAITSVHDMNFAEYIRLLESPANWDKIHVALDRKVFTAELNRIKDIRNDVMHFDPDGIPHEDIGVLRAFSKLMQRLRDLGVTQSAKVLPQWTAATSFRSVNASD